MLAPSARSPKNASPGTVPPPISQRPVGQRGVLAVAYVALTSLAGYLLQPVIGHESPFLFFLTPILLSAWFGGFGPGLLATVLAVAVIQVGLTPAAAHGDAELSALWSMAIFAMEGLVISVMGEARLRSEGMLRAARDWLEVSVEQRTTELRLTNELLAEQHQEREQAQTALVESETKFRSVLQSARDAIVIIACDGEVTFWNRGGEEMFGFSESDVLGLSITRLLSAEHSLILQSEMLRVASGAAPHWTGGPREMTGRRRDGTLFPLELSLSAWQTGETWIFGAILRDLTARKRAEDERVRLAAELAHSAEEQVAEERYKLIAETIPQIVWTAHADGVVDYFNRKWFEFTGLGAPETSGWSWQAVHPNDLQISLDRWLEAVTTGADYEVQYRLQRHDGVYCWHLVRAVPVRDHHNQIVKWFGTATDIDDQKRAEVVSHFLASAGASLAGQLEEGALVRDIAGLCAPALADWCFVDLVRDAEVGEAPQMLQRAALCGPPDKEHGVEARYHLPQQWADTPRGPWLALLRQRSELIETVDSATLAALTTDRAPLEILRSEPVRALACVPLMARGRALGVLTLAVTSPGKSLDRTALGMVEDLARNAALTIDNARLLDELQRVNTTKDEFLAVLSHELRTPLTAIVGWLQLLQGGLLDEETQRRALETIERNTHAQTQLIEDLLDLSRIVTGKLRLDCAPVPMASIIEASVETIRPAAQEKGVDVFVMLERGTGTVHGDMHRLQQVMWNLLSNAVKFTPRGGRVEVMARRIDSQLEVAVSDTGQGIAPEFLPHVFDRFRQADSSSTRRHGGLGLGLAIAHHVVGQHHGTLQVVSEGEGRGTVFTLRLPVSPLSALAPPEPARSAKDGSLETGKPDYSALLCGLRVMVVDDDRDARDMLSAALSRYGAQVCACNAAAQAVRELPAWRPDVLVSDIGMPQEDGYDLIRQVRALPPESGGAVPAMALTAYARTIDRDRALQAGFNRHVAKPVDPLVLAKIVAGLVGRE